MKFINKTAIITGVAGRMGTEMTPRFLGEGAKVVVVDLSIEELEKVSSIMGNIGNLPLIKQISVEKKTRKNRINKQCR